MSDVIVVRIKPNGDVNVKAEGTAGASCAEKTKPFRDAFGSDVDEARTAEWDQRPGQQQRANQ